MPKLTSLECLSLKRRIFIAFSLISLLPLLVIGFYFAYKNLPSYTYIILGINIILGWWLIIQIFNSISSVVRKMQEKVSPAGEIKPYRDEVKLLEELFDDMSVKIKKNFQELKEISKSTERLNEEVSKKVYLLSTILQINDLVSQGSEIKEVFNLVVRRVKEILNSPLSFILLSGEGENFLLESIESNQRVGIESLSKKEVFLKPLIEKGEPIILDETHRFDKGLKTFSHDAFGVDNLLLLPIFLKKEVIGILGIGNSEKNFSFSQEAIESLTVVSRHITFIVEHRKMSERIKDLEIKDPLTGLYNERFAKERLDEEINRAIASQRPCGFILIKIKNFKEYIERMGILSLESELKNIAEVLRDNLEIGQKAARLSDDALGIIAPEKSKAQLERQASFLVSKIKEKVPSVSQLGLVFVVTENPIDGVSAEELIRKASSLV